MSTVDHHLADAPGAGASPDGRGEAPDRRTLTDLLLHAADHHPRSGLRYVAGTDVRQTIEQTYPALLAQARRVAAGLRAAGLHPGDRVPVVAEQPQDFVTAFWGCVLGGLVPALLVPPRGDAADRAAHLDNVGRLLGSAALVTTERLRADLPATDGRPVLTVEELAAHEPPHRPAPAAPTAGPDDLALLMLTSGSTGSSKAVRLTHANLLASMAAKAERLAVTAADTTLNWITFDHIAAVEGHLLPLWAGADQVHVHPQVVLGDPLRFVQALDAHRVTVTFTPNFLLAQVNKAVQQRRSESPLDLSSVRVIISGGEATVCATARTFLDQLDVFGLPRGAIVPAFGMTETCAGSVFSRDFPAIDEGREFASLGHPVRGLEVRVVDDDGAPVPDGAVGELQVRGPMVFDGYLGDETATAEAFTADGWFRTGDRGTVVDGRLTLAGRSKDSIIVNGVSYYSHDLEAVLERLDGVTRSYVAAFPSRPAGSDTEQLVVAFAPTVPFDDEDGLHRAMVAIRNSTVLHWGFRPSLVLPLPSEEFPKSSLGKILRSRLRRMLEAGELADREAWVADLTMRQLGGYVEPETPTEAAVAEVYAGLFGTDPGAVSATANFFDLGGTSLDILQLKHAVEQRFGVDDLPVITLLTAPTVRELAARIDGGGAGADEYQPLVPLQLTGDKTPLFCVHPGVGEVLVFVNLAKYFVNERPFYALRARGFGEKEAYFGSFDEMVQCYVDAIRARQPHGPYAVAGYSYGGAVAFRIATALEALGERVDFVGILNLPPHIRARMHELDFVEGAVNLAFFLSLVTEAEAAELNAGMRELAGRDEQLELLWSRSSPERIAELDLDLPKFAAWVDLAQSLVDLGKEYEPSGTVRSLSVFYAIPLRGTKQEWLDEHLRRWDDFSREPNRYIDVPGEHYTMIGPDHVATFQAVLREELDRALGGR